MVAITVVNVLAHSALMKLFKLIPTSAKLVSQRIKNINGSRSSSGLQKSCKSKSKKNNDLRLSSRKSIRTNNAKNCNVEFVGI